MKRNGRCAARTLPVTWTDISARTSKGKASQTHNMNDVHMPSKYNIYKFNWRSLYCGMALNTLSQRRKAGFNLVEAAIVLGVVGLVIGGIWLRLQLSTEASRLISSRPEFFHSMNRCVSVIRPN